MDANFELAKAAKEKYNAKYAFDNIEELLALDEIQAVYIASPVAFHKEQTEAAAKAKKHILLEKPMTLTSEKSQELADICWENLNEDNKVSLFVRQIPLDGSEPTEIIINKNK